jgi:hypothetical protein
MWCLVHTQNQVLQWPEIVRDSMITFCLIFVFVYDILYQEILDHTTLVPGVILFVTNLLLGWITWQSMLIGVVVGAGFFLLQYIVSRGRWIGGGDVQMEVHKTIKKVGEDIESTGFNTAVSACMILLNEMEKAESVNVKDFKSFLQILAPFIPYVADQMWRELGEKKSIHLSKWPKFDPKKFANETVKIVVQVNGKIRTELVIQKEMDQEAVKAMALKDAAIIPWIEGKEVKRIIYVPGRLVNIVV